METVLTVATIACIAANAGIVIADLIPARFVLDNSTEVGLRPRVLPCLAALKAAGAIGLIAGLTWIDELGLAAGIGLTLFYTGAVVAHVRKRVFHNIGFPVFYLVLAAAALLRFGAV